MMLALVTAPPTPFVLRVMTISVPAASPVRPAAAALLCWPLAALLSYVIRVRVDPVSFTFVVAIDDEGIAGSPFLTAIDNVSTVGYAGIGDVPRDRVITCAGTDDVVSLAAEDVICAAFTDDDIVARTAVEHIGASTAKQQVVAGVAVQRVGRRRSEQRVVAGAAVERGGTCRRSHEIVVSRAQVDTAEGAAIEFDEFQDAVGIVEMIGDRDGLVVDGHNKISGTIVAGGEGIDVRPARQRRCRSDSRNIDHRDMHRC